MAGKPEPPQHHIQHQQHQQQPSVQNVVVYVSNDNFAQAYATAVNHQNVASYSHQQTQQNGGGGTATFTNPSQSLAPLVVPGKNLNKPSVKTQDFPNNGLVGNVSVPHQAGFYATNTSGIPQTNGFHHCHSPNVINNIAYNNNSATHGGTILNQGFSAASLKNLVNLGGHSIGQQQAVCPNNIESSPVIGNGNEICNGYTISSQQAQAHAQQRVAVSCAQQFFAGPEQKSNTTPHGDAGTGIAIPLSTSNYITSQGGEGSFVAVMGGDSGNGVVSSGGVGTGGPVVFPRCDSVRSETAESSCSSLSSADSQAEPPGSNSLAVLLPPGSSHHQSLGQHHLVANGNASLVQQSSGSSGINNGMMLNGSNVNIQHANQQTPGIVRTPSGAISLSQQQLGNIVLAMTVNNNQQLPAPTMNASQVNQPVMPTVPAQQSTPPSITVPFGWKRLNINGSIVYVSPSNTALSSLDHLKEYLQTQGTCKCGLECPLRCDSVFNFDPKVATRPWALPPDSSNSGDLTKLCNHKRKLLAIATLAGSGAGAGFSPQQQQQQQCKPGAIEPHAKAKKDAAGLRRKKRKTASGGASYSSVSVSQLLAQRERGMATAGKGAQGWSGGAPTPPVLHHHTGVPNMQLTSNRGTFSSLPQSFPDAGQQQGTGSGGSTGMPPQFLRYASAAGPNPQTGDASAGLAVHSTTAPIDGGMQLNMPQQHLIGMAEHTIQVQGTSANVATNSPLVTNMVHGGNVGMMGQTQRLPPHGMSAMEGLKTQTPPQQHVVYSSGQTPQDIHMMRMQQFYNQNQYQTPPPRLEDQNTPNKAMLQQQHPNSMQNQRPQFIPVSCAAGNVPQGGVFDAYGSRTQPPMVPQQHQNIVQMQHQHQQQQMVVTASPGNSTAGGTMMMHPQRAPPWQNRGVNSVGLGTNNSMMTMNQQHHSPVMSTPPPQSNSGNNQNSLPPPSGYDRVPPLHHHTPPPPIWTEDTSRKKQKGAGKSAAANKKQRPYNIMDHHHQHHHRVANQAMIPSNGGSGAAVTQGQEPHAPCPNVDVRQIPPEHNRPPPHPNTGPGSNYPVNTQPSNNSNVPSFMEDPSGYLAQQTALLNSTISRQTGVGGMSNMGVSGGGFMCHSPTVVRNAGMQDPQQPTSVPSTPPAQSQQQSSVVPGVVMNLPTSCSSPTNVVGVPLPSNVLLPAPKGVSYNPRGVVNVPQGIPQQQQQQQQPQQQQHPMIITSQHNPVSQQPPCSSSYSIHPSQMQHHHHHQHLQHAGVPDSSAVTDTHHGCQGCIATTAPSPMVPDGMIYHQQHAAIQHDHSGTRGQQHTNSIDFNKQFQHQQLENVAPVSTPTPEENPVTSSTFTDQQRHSQHQHRHHQNDSRGPIQGGTVSTSNGSPVVDAYGGSNTCTGGNMLLPQPEASPTSSSSTPTPSSRHPSDAATSTISSSSSSSSSSPFAVPNVSPPGTLYSPYHNSGGYQQQRSDVHVAVCSSPGMVARQQQNTSGSGRINEGYCHHLHEQRIVPGHGAKFTVTSSTAMVTTMASGHTVSSNTITSVLAGRTNTATVSIGNSSSTSTSNTPPTSAMSSVTGTAPLPPVYTSQAAAMMSITQPPQQQIHQIPMSVSGHHHHHHHQGMHQQQVTVSKSPLEMVQSVVSSIQVPQNMMGGTIHQAQAQQQQQQQPPTILKQSGTQGIPPGHILVSSGGQLIMANTGNVMTAGPATGIMAPPPQPLPPHSMGKVMVSHAGQVGAGGGGITTMPPMSVSPMMTSVTAAVTQVIPAVGVTQQVLGQPTVLVNALPAPLLIQPGVMTVDGMQNAMQIPHLAVATGNMIHHHHPQTTTSNGQIMDAMGQDRAIANGQGFLQRHGAPQHQHQQHPLLSPETAHHAAVGGGKKKGSKKRKVSPQTVASMLHIASQQNSPASLVVQQQQQQQQQSFPQQSFAMSGPAQGITTGPMLQALTIVPGKGGAPAQILMNGQPGTATATAGHFGTQQLIATSATSQPTQQINLLQPVNLLNGATGVVQNFPTFQQFIVPGLSGMVMATTADGTATLLPDTTNLGVQLQLQNVNGQNVLTPVQSHHHGGATAVFGHPAAAGQSILAAGPAGMVIRAPSAATATGGKLSTHTGATSGAAGPQFLAAGSPNQFLMNGAAFSGQLSPLVANVSPNHQMSFTAAPPGTRPASVVTTTHHHPQQEYIQCGQMGQTLMVPCSVATSATQNHHHQNTTVVQQNTTIVQQQTTMVSNNQQIVTGPHGFVSGNNGGNGTNMATAALNVNQNYILSNNSNNGNGCQEKVQHSVNQGTSTSSRQVMTQNQQHSQAAPMMKHSVSTQTAVNQSVQASSSSASPAVMPGALVVATSNTFCQTSTASSCTGSPPDTTTHSPVDPGAAMDGGVSGGRPPQSPAADTTTHSTGVGSTDDSGLSSPSPSSCPVTGSCGETAQGRPQVSSHAMPMVHCVSSSNEQESSCIISDQTEFEWGGSVGGGKGVFVGPAGVTVVDQGGFGSNTSSPRRAEMYAPAKYLSAGGGTGGDLIIGGTQGHLMCDKTGPPSYMEAFGGDALIKQEVVSSRQMFEYGSGEDTRVSRAAKRKHSDALVVMETHPRDIHALEEDDEEAGPGSEGRTALSEGDLVWGAARGFPAWPGKLVGPAAQSPTGKVWVRWFGGDRALTQVAAHTLKTLSEGLEAHHRARRKFRKSRKLNSQLENAIQEAMLELDRMTEQQQQRQQAPAQSTAVGTEPSGRLRRSHR